MSHVDDMINWFRIRGGYATLTQILNSGQGFAYEFRARMVDARKRGVVFTCQQDRRNPSGNLYHMIEKQKGQLELAI